MVVVAAVILASWLIGSVPAAYIVTRIALGKDIRSIGSGNAGATNVFRALGAGYAVPVLLFDGMKGFIPVCCVLATGFHFAIPSMYVALLSGTAAVLGHLFPVFIGWRGGKGVATGAGVIAALYPPLVPACLAVFLAVFLVTRKISLASICTAGAVPLLYLLLVCTLRQSITWVLLGFLTLLSTTVIARHWRNIQRLREGTEQRL